MQETWIWSLGRKDPLEKAVASHSSILPWEIPRTEEPGQAIVHEVSKSRTWLNNTDTHTHTPGSGSEGWGGQSREGSRASVRIPCCLVLRSCTQSLHQCNGALRGLVGLLCKGKKVRGRFFQYFLSFRKCSFPPLPGCTCSRETPAWETRHGHVVKAQTGQWAERV